MRAAAIGGCSHGRTRLRGLLGLDHDRLGQVLGGRRGEGGEVGAGDVVARVLGRGRLLGGGFWRPGFLAAGAFFAAGAFLAAGFLRGRPSRPSRRPRRARPSRPADSTVATRPRPVRGRAPAPPMRLRTRPRPAPAVSLTRPVALAAVPNGSRTAVTAVVTAVWVSGLDSALQRHADPVPVGVGEKPSRRSRTERWNARLGGLGA